MDTDYQSIGKRLQDAREQHGLTLEDISSSTKIQVRYLQAIENGQVNRLPGPFYVKAFIRQYANTVDLDPNTILDTMPAADRARQPKDDGEIKAGQNRGVSAHLFDGFSENKQEEQDKDANDSLSNNSIRVGSDRIPRAGMNLSTPVTRRLLSRLPVIFLIVALIILAFALWLAFGRIRPSLFSQNPVNSSSTSISQSSSSRPQSSSSSASSSSNSQTQPLSKPQFQNNTATMTFYDTADHTIQIQAANAGWTTVTVDNVRQFASTIAAGAEHDTTLSGDQNQIVIHLGNPYNTRILFDNQDTQFMSGSSILITNIIIRREKTPQ
ncbi:MAG: helix-turn-helix transcriptional regulator [Oenococcus sp.]|uniref:helix-turn-helix domain-containing protein n=1 Tax=Oenococcus sp. TaxID=1979414 RepID=UPI0039EAFBFD